MQMFLYRCKFTLIYYWKFGSNSILIGFSEISIPKKSKLVKVKNDLELV
jgi:hypothetical protein